jgi:O-antigen/teichoic acid export membrane protein
MPIRDLISKPFGLKSSIAANIAANAVTAAVFIVSVPLIIPYIGVEAYGLVGIFLAIQGVVMVLDIGLNVAITREFATKGSETESSGELWDLLRTSEGVYWGITAITFVFWLAVAGFARSYVNPQGLSAATVYRCFLIMGVPLVLQFPLSLYSAGLYGLQRQVLVSWISAAFAIARNLGVVAALALVSTTPETYFGWNALVVAIQVPVIAMAVRSAMPAAERKPKFELSLLTRQWKFVGGIGVVTFASVLLLQTDKFVLARMFSLETFGFYALAATVATGLQWLIQPVFRAFFPRLSQVAESGDRETLKLLYHQGCQLMAVVVLPVSAICVFFAWEVMLLWQRDQAAAANSSPSLRFLMVGGALNALLFLPYALQLAYGSTRIQLITLLAGLAASVPLTIAAASYWGPPGAAAVWLAVNMAFLIINVPLTHRRFLAGETSRWAIHDVLLPIIAAVISAGLMRLAYRDTDSYLLMALQLGVAFVIVAVSCFLAAGLVRGWMIRRLRFN